MKITTTRFALALAGVCLAAASIGAQPKPAGAPVEFTANASVTAGLATATTELMVHVERWNDEFERGRLVTALRTNGYQAFLPAFRRSPVVGYIQIKDQKWNLRWASQETTDAGQKVTVATEKPIYFLPAGSAAPKSRAGYEMGVVQMELDASGKGKGTMAGAARVKPTPDMKAVMIDDYADTPTQLTSVSRR